MAWHLSRREFLKFSTLTFLSGLAAAIPGEVNRRRYDRATGIELDADDENLSYEEVMRLCLKLARAAHILKLSSWRPALTDETLLAWSKEVSWQMYAEGLVDEPPVPRELSYFDPNRSPDQVNHVLAYSDCETYIKLSERFRNPTADWYNSPDWPAGVAHELIHLGAQQTELCLDAPDELLEATANIGAIVTLAAMANRGNGLAMRALVWEFLDQCLGAAFVRAYESDRLAEYNQLRRLVYPGILSEARFEKINREYEGRTLDRLEILRKYYLLPVEIIMRSHLTNNDTLTGLILKPRALYTASYNGNPIIYIDRVLRLRDWTWIMGHLNEMSQAYAASPVESIVR